MSTCARMVGVCVVTVLMCMCEHVCVRVVEMCVSASMCSCVSTCVIYVNMCVCVSSCVRVSVWVALGFLEQPLLAQTGLGGVPECSLPGQRRGFILKAIWG